MYDNKRTIPMSVKDYITLMEKHGDVITFEEVKSLVALRYVADLSDESDAAYDEAESLFEKKMESFTLNTLISKIVTYKGEGTNGYLYHSEDLNDLSDYHGKFC